MNIGYINNQSVINVLELYAEPCRTLISFVFGTGQRSCFGGLQQGAAPRRPRASGEGFDRGGERQRV